MKTTIALVIGFAAGLVFAGVAVLIAVFFFFQASAIQSVTRDIQSSYDLQVIDFRAPDHGAVAWKAKLLNNRSDGTLGGYVTVRALDKAGFEVGREVVNGFNILPHRSEMLTGNVMVDKSEVTQITATLSERWLK